MFRQKLSLNLDEIMPGMVTAEQININDDEGKLVMTVRPSTVLSEDIIRRLARHKLVEAAVYLNEASVPDTPPIESMLDDSLREEAVDNIRSLFGALGEGGNMTTAYQAVRELDNIVGRLVDTINSESNSYVHIADLKSYDEYTYHHSLSVAVLAIAIGTGLGLNLVQLKRLGQCAIMHDIGKTDIPLEIINKPGRLTNEEFEIIKQHAVKSGEYLERGEIGDAEIWSSVVHHHEKMDGSGYPDGLKGDDIPFFSKIISVADVYDAVTSYRSYRKPMPPGEAIEMVMSEIGRSFEYKIVKVFIDKLELYPINSVVELTNNRLGLVVDNTDNLRPTLRMLDDGSIVDLMNLDNLSLIITRVMDMTG